MSKENTEISVGMGALGFFLWGIMTVGTPDLIDALIYYFTNGKMG